MREATASNCKILSKYLPLEISVFFPFRIVSPDDHFQPSLGWLNKVIGVAQTKCPVPGLLVVRLGLGQKDLDHNTCFLMECRL